MLETMFIPFAGLAVEAGHLEQIYNSGFDGMYTYFASDTFVYGSKPMNWNHISSYCKQREMMFIPSVGPGYIDTEVSFIYKYPTTLNYMFMVFLDERIFAILSICDSWSIY